MSSEAMVLSIQMAFTEKFINCQIFSKQFIIINVLQVHYTAGPEGFKAKINSNEPFLKPNANPADVVFFVEEPPQSAINYGKHQTNGYPKDEPNDYFDDIDNNEMNDQSYKASVNRVRGFDNRFINNDDNRSFGRIRSFLDMFSESCLLRIDWNINCNNFHIFVSFRAQTKCSDKSRILSVSEFLQKSE